MNISSIHAGYLNNLSKTTNTKNLSKTTAEEKSEQTGRKEIQANRDVYIPSTEVSFSEKKAVVSETLKPDQKTEQQVNGTSSVNIPSKAQQMMDEFNTLIVKTFGSQANMYAVARGEIDFSKFTAADISNAQKSLEPGGPFSVDAVATRIMDMAVALSGGDESKISVLRDAVIKGFNQAGMEVGGNDSLPDICHKTFDEVMRRFDSWEQKSKNPAKTEELKTE